MCKTYYTVYKTTNLITGGFYIGVHKTSNPNDNYLGSGNVIRRAIKKYGSSNFQKEILACFDSAEEMFAEEARLVTVELTELSECYNISLGGNGGLNYKGSIGYDNLVKANRAKAQSQFKRSVSKYLLSPVRCKGCSCIIPYNKRKNKFCSSSCSATYNNTLRPKKILP